MIQQKVAAGRTSWSDPGVKAVQDGKRTRFICSSTLFMLMCFLFNAHMPMDALEINLGLVSCPMKITAGREQTVNLVISRGPALPPELQPPRMLTGQFELSLAELGSNLRMQRNHVSSISCVWGNTVILSVYSVPGFILRYRCICHQTEWFIKHICTDLTRLLCKAVTLKFPLGKCFCAYGFRKGDTRTKRRKSAVSVQSKSFTPYSCLTCLTQYYEFPCNSLFKK